MKKKILTILAVLVLLAVYTFVEPFWINEVQNEIISKDIPKGFNNFKIVFVSDIHHGPYISLDRVKSLVSRINGLNPDMIILGGDYVSRDPKYIKPCIEELGGLKSRYGVFGVLGNHDHYEGASLTRKCMRENGITLLDNKAFWVYKGDERIKLGGVGDYYEDKKILTPTIGDTSEKDFVILVSHNPDYAEELETDNIDLMLSGHTHGGQVTLFGLWAPIIPSQYGNKYRTGPFYKGNMELIVSNGIGAVTPPGAILCPTAGQCHNP